MLTERLRGHRGTVAQLAQHCHRNTEVPVDIHFRGQGHTVCDPEIIPIEKVRQNNKKKTFDILEHLRVFFYI